jgi:hypothetical protein
MIERKTSTNIYSHPTTTLYSKYYHILSSTIFNRAHKEKMCSDHKQQRAQLQNSITPKLGNQIYIVNALWKDHTKNYKIFHSALGVFDP